MKFCEYCGTRLEIPVSTTKLSFVCKRCEEEYDSTPEDSLVFSLNFRKDDTLKYQVFLKSAYQDPTNLIVDVPCVKCKAKLTKMVRVGEKMTPTYVCKCGHIF